MMNQEDLFKKIGLILNELNTQYEFLARNPQQLNELELALFHANADFLSDHAKILIKICNDTPLAINTAEDVAVTQLADLHQGDDRRETLEAEYYGDSVSEEQQVEAVTFAEDPIFETEEEEGIEYQSEVKEELFKLDQSPSTFEFIINEKIEQENDQKFDYEEKSVDELFNRPLSQEEENILAQKRKLNELAVDLPVNAEEDEIGPEPFLVTQEVEVEFPIQEEDLTLEIAKEPVINTTQNAIEDPTFKPTLNDILASKMDRSTVADGNAPRISDLKQGVNLNDKLLYIKDLFNGYNLAYAEAIDLANKLPNFEAADTFFKKNYAVQNNWADRQETVDKFYSLLNRRFK
ncbi:MAG: hypothetical protein EOO90_13830 [Pedobacter sp.]|nr:MAG: hypothetical protein EOO90_13830 [Pedobacter sp.]